MNFPEYRLRRLRKNKTLRRMVAETTLDVSDLVLPIFVTSTGADKKPISSMPGHFQLSTKVVAEEAKQVSSLGIPAVILFGIPDKKDDMGMSAFDSNGPVQDAIKAIKDATPELVVITDVCMCEYTSHGHCGIIKEGDVDNDSTLELLSREALSHAEAGADMVAPSDMMDGRVQAIRSTLDHEGFVDVPIMSYAAKYASAYYGPFREAAESTPEFGDRRSYQMDAANTDEAVREVSLDIAEGADIVMVKPALAYLDVIRRIKDEFDYPLAAYNVSGEFSMVKAAAEKGWIDGEKVMMETLLAIRRAGAKMILTYFAKEAAEVLNG